MQRRSSSREFKVEAVRLVRERGVSVAQVVRDLDVHEDWLRNWVKRFADEPLAAFPGHGKTKAAEAGLVPSVGSAEDSYDNALAETLTGLYKAEVIWRKGPWRSFEAVVLATPEWVDWFKNRRLLEPIGSVPPAEAEAASYAALERPAKLAA